ncbi:MAG: lipoyl synthase [Kiritimatiellae bacterium]|nr:lipoyl synthase [Kiritimatiellia bacterium]
MSAVLSQTSPHLFRPGRLPPWFRRPLPAGGRDIATDHALKACSVETVCREARCPNRGKCFSEGAAAFLVLGTLCTRACRFCAIDHATSAQHPLPPDPSEPVRLATAAARLGLRHVVITSVTRDDLPDGGAAHFAAILRALHQALPTATTEVLVPDFQGSAAALQAVLDAAPTILNHNLETTRALHPAVRPQARYDRSLELLARAAAAGFPAKSGLMLGLGESPADLRQTLRDLRAAGVTLLTLGQYLPPSSRHYPLACYVPPEEFDAWRDEALALGFASVAAGPFVRSSYHAADLLQVPVRPIPIPAAASNPGTP